MPRDEDVARALDGLETGRRRIVHERTIAAAALANLYERLGAKDEDVAALDCVLTDWHSMLVQQADGLSSFARHLDD